MMNYDENEKHRKITTNKGFTMIVGSKHGATSDEFDSNAQIAHELALHAISIYGLKNKVLNQEINKNK